MEKKLVFIVSIISVILITLYYIPRYGWKLYGFKYCSNPSMIFVSGITINSNEKFVKIFGNTSSSSVAYVGTIHKLDGSILYIGIKYNSMFGFLKRNGDFDIKIIINTNDIEKIIIRGNQEDKTIYEKGGPQ
jgi:hypothetical protein